MVVTAVENARNSLFLRSISDARIIPDVPALPGRIGVLIVRTHGLLFLIVFTVATVPLASAQTASQHKPHPKSRKAAKPFVLPPMPRGPLQPVPLDQLPAVPPQVSYQDGNLTIIAENSTLGDILREVHKKTGASIDVPGNPMERVATDLGPGPARDVLAKLLNGTSFNYVMVGSPADPAVLSSIALTSRPNGPATETAQNQPVPVYTPPQTVTNFGPGTGRPGMVPPGFVPPQGFQQPPQPVNTADAGDDSDNSDDDSADDSADDNSDQSQPGVGGPAGQNGQPGQPPNAGPRTPQQILQMLQRNQQQQQNGQPPQPQQPPDDQQN